MNYKSLVSIIIINWNRKTDLENCLALVFQQDYKNKEIIVVDNNSSDGSVEMIQKKFPSVIILANKENLGACVAKNNGIKISKGEYVWFLDNDSFAFNKKTLSSMVSLSLKLKKIGAIGGEAWIEGGLVKGTKKRKLLPNGESIHLKIYKNNNFIEGDYLSTANFFVKKNLLNSVGGFNPIYFYLYEDTDISFKIKRKGLKLISSRETLINHAESKDTSRITNFFRINKNRIIFVFLNFNLFYFSILPILDLLFLFDPRKFLILKEKSSVGSSKSRDFLMNLIRFGSNYFKSILLAYSWVLFNFWKLVPLRRVYFGNNF
ncbi:MAG: glycosyltransferase family 2 protein [Candidatus Pacearchaeota archaeon]